MKKNVLVAGGVTALLLGVLAFPSVARWRENRRRASIRLALMPPQDGRALKMPTEAQFRERLPGHSRVIFENANTLTLYSLEARQSFDANADRNPKLFHDHLIVGATTLNSAHRKALRASFYDGLSFAYLSSGCFSPRHGIRATYKGQTLDLLICFSCSKYKMWQNGKPLDYYQDISYTPHDTFNRFLTDANVPLPQY